MIGYMVPQPPVVNPKAPVQAQAANATLVPANFDYIQTNTGAAGQIVLTLPAAADVAGRTMRVQLTAAQVVRLTPAATEKVYLGGSGVVAKYLNVAGVIGNYVDIYSDGDDYLVLNYAGVLTKEP